MIDGPGACDGGCSPNTEEWVELYNSCSTPVDVSCFILFDGDFSVRFPAGSIIPANGYFVIGSNNSGVAVDLNWGNCSCTTNNSEVGIFTNDNEQLVLLNNNGIVQDAIVWGAGQLPVSVNSTFAGCNPINTSFNAASGIFETISINSADNGCAYARACDGLNGWEMRCGTDITAGETNGLSGFVDFDASSSIICQGDCIDFQNLSTLVGTTYAWSFEGSSTSTSTTQNPVGICYPTAGTFDVTLTVTSACGLTTQTYNDFITVNTSTPPIVNAAGLTTFCEGQFVNLLTGSPGPYQWLVDGNPIPSANDFSLLVLTGGSYQLELNGGNCGAISSPIDVTVISTPSPTISSNDLVVCFGETETLSTEAYSSYQWLLNGIPISGAINQTLTVQNTGNYSIEVESLGGCQGLSEEVTIQAVDDFTPLVIPSTDQIICEGTSIELSSSEAYDSYQWFLNGMPVGASASLNASLEGNYTLEGNILGCTSVSEPITITVELAPVGSINALGSTTFCEGGIVNLQASGNHVTIEWFLDGVNQSSVFNNITASNSGTYNAVLYSLNGCMTTTNSIDVAILNVPNANILEGTNIVSCIPNLNLTAQGGASYVWQYNGAVIPGATQPTINITLEGNYSVSAIGSNGCSSDLVSTSVDFLDPPVVDINFSDDTVCVGEVILLQVPAIFETTTWSTGESSNLIYASQTGEYTVTVRDENNCEASDSVYVVVSPLPFIDVLPEVESDCVQGAVVEAFSDGFISWPLEDYMEVLGPNLAVANPARNATFTITAVLNDCISIVPVRVNVECSTLFIPNSFTPDNDGVNDYFQIVANDVTSYELIIFNRFGEVVFRSIDPTEGWDGGVNGYYVPDGVYNYSLQALDKYANPLFNEPVTYGTITVIR